MNTSSTFQIQDFREGLKAGLPVIIGYWAVGFACGAIGISSGFSLWAVASLAIFLNSGSAHFLTYSLISIGASPLQVALGVAFVNLRYVLVSLYMSQYFKNYTGFQKLINAYLITDESFGIATGHAKQADLDRVPYAWMLGVNLTGWVHWWVACIVGSLLAAQLPNWIKDSLAFSLSGMFIGLVIVAFYASRNRLIDAIVILTSIILVTLFHGHIADHLALLLTCILGASLGLILYRIFKGKNSCTP